ncbi:MAG: hypothetical protein P1P69_02425, partial [Methanosarcinaceae archaeon]|nr:hypothetical protein [Methanosarcinaceae archaeon]
MTNHAGNHADVVNANFITGILWEYGGTGDKNYYDGSQNLVFVTKLRPNASGLPGISGMHNYEISIPSTLNATVDGDMDFFV